MFPKELARITKHKKPLYQLYQPGFNISNSCWIEGGWVTVPPDEWESRKESHLKLYKDLGNWMKGQSHRNKGKVVAKLTPAERQAYEHCSGTLTIDCLIHDRAQPVGVDLAGGKLTKKSLEFLRRDGYKVIARVKNPNGTVKKQLDLGVPDDLMIDTGEPYDFWANIVEVNKQRARSFFDESLNHIDGEVKEGSLDQFAVMMATQMLLDVEEEIIRAEHKLSLGTKDLYTDLEEEKVKYADMRRALEDKGLHEAYEQAKSNHNECERHNLDNSKGTLYCYVLPVFHLDGTHEPWGERDVPWGLKADDLAG